MSAVIVVMGVAGSGKTTIGRLLAHAVGLDFVDADDLHSDQARATMAAGTPLTDDDRWPWLARVAARMAEAAAGGGLVVACSALRRRYRDALVEGAGAPVLFVHLDAAAAVIGDRMDARAGHFMPRSLLDSQFQTLEPLEPDETGIRVDADRGTEEIVAEVLAVLGG